jgi:hypothetical protein
MPELPVVELPGPVLEAAAELVPELDPSRRRNDPDDLYTPAYLRQGIN